MKIIVTTFGSLGDLHPYLAIALGLKSRGHEAVLVTSDCYRRKVEALGLGFRAMRPDSTFVDDPAVMRRVMDLRTGLEHVLRRVILPAVRESYEDTLAATEGADLLVSHPICFAAGLVAETTGTPWASTMVTPLGLASAYDPPTLPGYTGLCRALRPLGPAFWGPLRRLLKRATRPWARPIDRLRADLGLPPAVAHPLVDGHSPSLHLALFSKSLSAEQPDWPPQTVITGFPFFDRDGETGLPPDLARFLDDGPPPVVFTLGYSASTVAGRFYQTSAEAAVRLGRRAVLVLKDPRNRPPSLPDGVTAVEYAPFSAAIPTVSLDRPPRRGRHHRPGDAVGEADAGGAVRPRPPRQRRPPGPAGCRPHPLPPSLQRRPGRPRVERPAEQPRLLGAGDMGWRAGPSRGWCWVRLRCPGDADGHEPLDGNVE